MKKKKTKTQDICSTCYDKRVIVAVSSNSRSTLHVGCPNCNSTHDLQKRINRKNDHFDFNYYVY